MTRTEGRRVLGIGPLDGARQRRPTTPTQGEVLREGAQVLRRTAEVTGSRSSTPRTTGSTPLRVLVEYSLIHVVKACRRLPTATTRRDAILHHVARHRPTVIPTPRRRAAHRLADRENMLESRPAAQNDNAAFDAAALIERRPPSRRCAKMSAQTPYPPAVRYLHIDRCARADDAPYRDARRRRVGVGTRVARAAKQRATAAARAADARRLCAAPAEFWAEVSVLAQQRALVRAARRRQPDQLFHDCPSTTQDFNEWIETIDRDYLRALRPS